MKRRAEEQAQNGKRSKSDLEEDVKSDFKEDAQSDEDASDIDNFVEQQRERAGSTVPLLLTRICETLSSAELKALCLDEVVWKEVLWSDGSLMSQCLLLEATSNKLREFAWTTAPLQWSSANFPEEDWDAVFPCVRNALPELLKRYGKMYDFLRTHPDLVQKRFDAEKARQEERRALFRRGCDLVRSLTGLPWTLYSSRENVRYFGEQLESSMRIPYRHSPLSDIRIGLIDNPLTDTVKDDWCSVGESYFADVMHGFAAKIAKYKSTLEVFEKLCPFLHCGYKFTVEQTNLCTGERSLMCSKPGPRGLHVYDYVVFDFTACGFYPPTSAFPCMTGDWASAQLEKRLLVEEGKLTDQ